MKERPNINELFGRRLLFPDAAAKQRYDGLVGLEDHKTRLSKILSLLVNPASLQAWQKKFHPDANEILKAVLNRPPLVILAGDVGCGKTALAESVGDEVARQNEFEVTLFPLSLATRGEGRVGEMTQLLSAAFDYTVSEANKLKGSSQQARGAIILLVDEADAIAQSREASQMHHEDRAGVNAFICGINQVEMAHCPCAVIMCTNRPNSLDPAVRRRAAEIIEFSRPTEAQRKEILSSALNPLGFSEMQIKKLVGITGSGDKRKYGFTFSDLVQRLLPAMVLDAYPLRGINPNDAIAIAEKIEPTPPFNEGHR